jgi:hypothetical protein
VKWWLETEIPGIKQSNDEEPLLYSFGSFEKKTPRVT